MFIDGKKISIKDILDINIKKGNQMVINNNILGDVL